MKINQILRNLNKINLKTIYFNLKHLPFKQAIHLPIWISQRCIILKGSGTIIIKGAIIPGMIKIGYGNITIFDKKRSRSILQINGNIIFNGKAKIGHGSRISIGKGAELDLGANFSISAETSIICQKGIKIGNDCLFSWDVLIMDTDFHKVMNEDNKVINEPKQINIGDKVWIGCRTLILKGVDIPSGNIIAANSTITKTQIINNAIIGGNPTIVLRKNITWEN